MYDPSAEEFKSDDDSRPILLLSNFKSSHNKLRVLSLESAKGVYTTKPMQMSMIPYFNWLTRSKYVLSPPGKLCLIKKSVFNFLLNSAFSWQASAKTATVIGKL